MTSSLSLAARLRVLAAPHRTDRLKVLHRMSDIGAERWNTITELMGLSPGQHPDSIELCENADGQGGSLARATRDGDRWFFFERNGRWTRIDPMPWPPRADVEERDYARDLQKDRLSGWNEFSGVLRQCVRDFPEVSSGSGDLYYAVDTNVGIDFTFNGDYSKRRRRGEPLNPGFVTTWFHDFELVPGRSKLTTEQRKEWAEEASTFKQAVYASAHALQAWLGDKIRVEVSHRDGISSFQANSAVAKSIIKLVPDPLADFEHFVPLVDNGEAYKAVTQALEPLRSFAYEAYAQRHGIDSEVLDFVKVAQLACTVRTLQGSVAHANLNFENLETPMGDDFSLTLPSYCVEPFLKSIVARSNPKAFHQWADNQVEAFRARVPELAAPMWAWTGGETGSRLSIHVVLGDDISILTPELAQRVGKAAARWFRSLQELSSRWIRIDQNPNHTPEDFKP